MNLLTVGMVNDIFVENQNDDYEYDEVADQADFAREVLILAQTNVIIFELALAN